MSEHPEQHVIDEIDRLVTQSIEHGYTDDYDAPYKETCETCGFEWHGEPSGIGCPGAYSSDEQREAFKADHQLVRQLVMVPDDGSPPYRFIGVLTGHGPDHVEVEMRGFTGDPDESRYWPDDGSDIVSTRARRVINFGFTFDEERLQLAIVALQQDSDDTVLGDTP
jgi:hypothetical protein